MTHIVPNEMLHVQALMPLLDDIIQRRARQIIAAKSQGKETQYAEQDLNTLYQVRTLITTLDSAYQAIIKHLSEIYQAEAEEACHANELLHQSYESAANGEKLYAELILQLIQKQSTK